ncbi:hypothetical protein Tco_0977404 [Tanacetum coccineum]|uniref:Uncharacterized protein n=1 Tax=Tanacetum coccineum TaxID=301880 RepID=A0ABQ5EKG6_9ASTR
MFYYLQDQIRSHVWSKMDLGEVLVVHRDFLTRPKLHFTSDLLTFTISMANPPPNDLNANLPEDEPVQTEYAPIMLGFAPAMLNILNNNNGWIEEDDEEDMEAEEEDEEEM